MKYTKQLEEWLSGLNQEQFNNFLKLFKNEFDKPVLEMIEKGFATKHMQLKCLTDKKNNINESGIKELYWDELEKISFIINSEDILKKIGGLKVLVYGPTGTGKTTLINNIISTSPFETIQINFTKILSHKMGQTQINLINLADELNCKTQRVFLFVDELDAIVTNRQFSDLGEHSRIIATFLQFLDKLNENIMLFVATNYFENIDSAIIRRFQVKIETNFFGIEQFLKLVKQEGADLSTQKVHFLIKNVIPEKNKFSFSDVQEIVNENYIMKEMGNLKNDESLCSIILKMHPEKFEIDAKKLSKRRKKEIGIR